MSEDHPDDPRTSIEDTSAVLAALRPAEPEAFADQHDRLRARMFGHQRFGNYDVIGELGRGGMGIVYAARDTRLGRKVAIKTVRHDGDDELRARLEDEARAMAQLSHPHIVTVHEFGEHEGSTFIVMEHVEGDTLRAWLRQGQRSTAEILEAFRAAGEALAYAHERGLVHRDFKPANVMLGDDGRVRVMDFGLARVDPACAVTRPVIPGEGTPAELRSGTPAYMAPEQFCGQWVDAACDQFAYCVALYEALYGQRPFAGRTRDELLAAIERRDLREPCSGADVPVSVRAVLLRGLAPDPADRFESMRALLDALADSTQPSPAPTLPPPRTTANVSSTRGRVYLGALLASALAVGALLPRAFGIGEQTNIMKVVACRAQIVTIRAGVELAEVKVINLESGEMMAAKITDNNVVIFQCPAAEPVDVMIVAEYTDGSRSTWSVTVHPLLNTTLADADATHSPARATLGAAPRGLGVTSLPRAPARAPDEDAASEASAELDPATGETGDEKDAEPRGARDNESARPSELPSVEADSVEPSAAEAPNEDEPDGEGETEGEAQAAASPEAPEVKIKCNRQTMGANDPSTPKWCK